MSRACELVALRHRLIDFHQPWLSPMSPKTTRRLIRLRPLFLTFEVFSVLLAELHEVFHVGFETLLKAFSCIILPLSRNYRPSYNKLLFGDYCATLFTGLLLYSNTVEVVICKHNSTCTTIKDCERLLGTSGSLFLKCGSLSALLPSHSTTSCITACNVINVSDSFFGFHFLEQFR